MSHELRTPLNGVIGYSQLLQRDRGLTAQQREALDAITKCGAHLLELINDVLDLSKIEAGRIDIEQTRHRPAAAHHRSRPRDRRRRRDARACAATCRSIPDLPTRVVLDGRHLRQILLNLLGNAIKFTAKGEVSLEIARTDDDTDLRGQPTPGPASIPKSCRRSSRRSRRPSSGAAAGGTGLGLTISRHLLQIMGADLHVDSVGR